jgi:hypothetical protein
VPVAAAPPITPFTDQVKLLLVREGVNCWVAPARTFAVLGDIVKVSEAGGVEPGGVSAQLVVINARTTTAAANMVERRKVPSQLLQDCELTPKTLPSGKSSIIFKNSQFNELGA